MSILRGSIIPLTGGTGSIRNPFLPMVLEHHNPLKVIIYSRNEMKQREMAKIYVADDRVRFFIGDVGDRKGPYRAVNGVDFIVRAADAKIVPTAEYNPFEDDVPWSGVISVFV